MKAKAAVAADIRADNARKRGVSDTKTLAAMEAETAKKSHRHARYFWRSSGSEIETATRSE